jgi:two-component sensor histidine kinase
LAYEFFVVPGFGMCGTVGGVLVMVGVIGLRIWKFRRRDLFLVLGSSVSAAIMVLTCAALIGYATGHRLPLSGGTTMAFHTSMAFLVLSWGVLAVVCPTTHGQSATLINVLLSIPIGATTLGVSVALWLLPAVSGNHGTDSTRPVGPVVAVLTVTACMITASLMAARLGFGRAALMRTANTRLRDEIAQREQIESAQRLLVSELDHRVRNTLSQVLALAESTVQTAGTVEQYHTRFRDRIRALSRAHSVLARTHRSDADLGEFLRAVLEPFAANGEVRIRLDGPPTLIPSRATTALCVVFYELAANAAKHGSLRAPNGHVDLTWRLFGGNPETLEIEWRETGGPPITGMPGEGFGTDLIRNIVPHELGGKTELTFAPEGVRCRVRLELRRDADESPLRARGAFGGLVT